MKRCVMAVLVPARHVFLHALLFCAVVEAALRSVPFGCRPSICFCRTSSLTRVRTDLFMLHLTFQMSLTEHAVRITC